MSVLILKSGHDSVRINVRLVPKADIRLMVPQYAEAPLVAITALV